MRAMIAKGRPALLGLGLLLLLPYLYALRLQDLRVHALGFEAAFWAAFLLYAAAAWLALRLGDLSSRWLVALFVLAAGMQAILVFTRPTLSDDMYRYVWEGRVQVLSGLSPYRYPPNAPELASLRDPQIWASVNRKPAVTIYPPLAEATFALLWRIWPDSVRWFQIVMAGGALLAGGLLVGLLRDLGRPTARVLIYLWSPLLIFETAHSAHLDGLVLPLLVGAWWARQRQRDALAGALLGLAAAYKLYPILLLPALWRPDNKQGRWQMPAACLGVLVASYLPAVLSQGSAVIGFLPNYLSETFNLSPLVQAILAGLRELNAGEWMIFIRLHGLGLAPLRELALILLGTLALLGLYMLRHPAQEGETALRRSLWLMGAFILLSHDLFSWYLLWLLPLLAIFLQPASLGRLPALRADAWTGWWLFCGLAALSYTFFIRWRPVAAAVWAQFLPLYALLLVDGVRWLYQASRFSPGCTSSAGCILFALWKRLADRSVRG
jgi:alpha-1,6-mannosyltransferase